jgi:hypothetical protein
MLSRHLSQLNGSVRTCANRCARRSSGSDQIASLQSEQSWLQILRRKNLFKLRRKTPAPKCHPLIEVFHPAHSCKPSEQTGCIHR